MIYPPPTGPNLSDAESRQLDDQYLSSNPTGYFRSRVFGLLAAYQHRNEPQRPAAGFERQLRNLAATLTVPTPDEIELQIATDAVQLRDHVAETLLRFLLSRFTLRLKGSGSLWMEMTDSPRQMKDVIAQLDAHLMDEAMLPVLLGFLYPLPPGTELPMEDYLRPTQYALDWVERAIFLVTSHHIDLSAASNKIRHGAMTAAYNDRRAVAFLDRPENPERIPLSAFQSEKAIDLIRDPVIEYISQPPKSEGVRPGYERTILNVDVETTLAEAWLMALLHGNLFYCAAYRHHGNDATRISIPQPPWAVGPSPEQLLQESVLGFRFPLTTAPDGSLVRPSGLANWDGTFIPSAFQKIASGVVVD